MMRALVGVVCLAATVACAQLFIDRYWTFRDCFGDEGRCYDPDTEQVLLPIAGPLWGTCTLISFAGVVGALTVPGRARKKREQRP
ncbi:MAG: hypothetical protein SFW67_28810 [Myxococcaceae bacterium]|nr:hypothetical protein [Myxococcaceae bacterium]